MIPPVIEEDFREKGFVAGRVICEHRERYIVTDGKNEYDAEITGNMRFSAGSRLSFPAVGDWVLMMVYGDDQAIIHRVLPRKSVLERRAAGKNEETQVIGANIDTAFIVQSVTGDFNLNRLERYITICLSAGIEPVLVLTKTDLSDTAQLADIEEKVTKREKNLEYFLVSNIKGEGLEEITGFLKPGKTYCVMGLSGSGKSSLINNLLHRDLLRTSEISTSTGKGRHTTSRRELFFLENGAAIIDTPGMKLLGIADDMEGLASAFDGITELSARCRFKDCTHTSEKGCEVIAAVEAGLIDQGAYNNYLKLLKEQEHFSASVAERRRKERIFGKMLKDYSKQKDKDGKI